MLGIATLECRKEFLAHVRPLTGSRDQGEEARPMRSEKISNPVEDLIILLDHVRQEAQRADLTEVAFIIELAITAAIDAAGGLEAGALVGAAH